MTSPPCPQAGVTESAPKLPMTIATLFNLAGPDLLIILVIAVLFTGGKNLPGIARSVGEAIREFTKAKDQ
jgi:sec-independent protein translocase protein TatA